jgi:hypothetical protein
MVYRGRPLGNLIKRNIHLFNIPKPCPIPYCSAPFWALWYGVNPWDYIGKKADDCEYCRFALSHLKNEKSNIELNKKREVYVKDRVDVLTKRKGIINYIINTLKREK